MNQNINNLNHTIWNYFQINISVFSLIYIDYKIEIPIIDIEEGDIDLRGFLDMYNF